MTFRSLAAQRATHPETNEFRIGVEKRGVAFKLPQDAATRLAWAPGTKLDVHLGEGVHAGQVILMPDRFGWSLLAAGAKSKGLRLVVNRRLFPGAPDIAASKGVRYELHGNTAIIAWLPWIEQASAPQAEEAAPQGDTPLPTADDSLSGGDQAVVTDLPVAGREGQPIPEPAATVDAAEQPPEPNGNGVDGGDAVAEVKAGPAPGRTERPDGPPKPANPQFAQKPGSHPSAWSDLKKSLFIEAALDGKGDSVLAKIAQRPVGSIWNIRNHVLKVEIDAARAARRVAAAAQQPASRPATPPPFKAGPLPPAPSSPPPSRMVPRDLPAGTDTTPKPTLSPELLKFLRDECLPVLLPLGIKVIKNDADTGLLRNGKPVTVDEVVAEVNRLLADGDPDFEPIKFDAAA